MTKETENWSEQDEERASILMHNGNDGDHYDSVEFAIASGATHYEAYRDVFLHFNGATWLALVGSQWKPFMPSPRDTMKPIGECPEFQKLLKATKIPPARPVNIIKPTSAVDLLDAAKGHIGDRARTYDKPEGERSMAATVQAFAAVTGITLTEEQGWLFQIMLKAVRSQQGFYRGDNYEDGAAYFALMGETAARDRP